MATFVWAAPVAGAWATGANWKVGGVVQAAPPTAADDVLFGSGTGATQSNMTTLAAGDTCQSIDFTGYTGTFTHTASVTWAIVRSLKLVPGMTFTVGGTGTSVIQFSATTDNGGAGWPITMAGKQTGPLTFNGVGGRWTCQDALLVGPAAGVVSAITLTLTAGYLDLGSFTHSLGALNSSGSTVRTLAGTGTINITSTANATLVNLGNVTNLTWSMTTAAFVLSTAAAVRRIFSFNGKTIASFTYTVAASAGECFFSTAWTMTTLSVSGGARLLGFQQGATFTLAAGGFNVFGTTGNLITIASGSAGSAFTISMPSGLVDANFLSLKDSAATGGASWWAEQSTNVSGNTGWNFGAPRTITDLFGTVDSRTQVQGWVRTITDPFGLVDAAAQVSAGVRAVTDAFGLADSRAIAAGYVRALTDVLGLVDAAAKATAAARPITDAFGLTDARAQVTAAVRALVDVLGLTDAAGRATGSARAVTDVLGIIDAVDRAMAAARATTDPFGVTDAVTPAGGYARVLADPFGLVDSSTIVEEHARTIVDALGLTDSVTAQLLNPQILRTILDAFGVTDTAGRAASYPRVFTDPLALTDDTARAVAARRVILDAFGVTDPGLVVALFAVLGRLRLRTRAATATSSNAVGDGRARTSTTSPRSRIGDR